MKTISFKSPKNKYRATVNYSKSLKGIGSVSSASAMNIDELKAYIQCYIDQANRNKVSCLVVITKNKKEYPLFDWKEIERYKS